MNDNIKTVMFDFGGVLVDLDQSKCVEAFVKLGVNNIMDYISKYVQNGLFLDLEKGNVTNEEFHDRLRRECGINATDEEINAAWCDFLIEIPTYKLQFIRELRKRKRVIMLSNTNAIHFDNWALDEFKKDGHDIDYYFDHCYLSYKMHCAKPEEEIFDRVIENEENEPGEILFIDDGEKNVEMARRKGFNAILVKEKEDWRHIFED